MRVLAIPKDFPTEQNPQSGIFVLRRLQATQALGHEVRVLRVVPHAPPVGQKWSAYRAIPESEVVEGIPVIATRAFVPPRLIGMEYLGLQLRGRLLREIAAFQPDIVHADYLIPCGHIAIHQPLPSIVTMHGIDAYNWPFRRRGLRRAATQTLERATRVVAVSDFLARFVQAIARRDIRVSWNGADERVFHHRDPAFSRDSLDLPRDRFIVAFAGTVLRQKGILDLIEAVGSLPDDRPRPLVVIAGSGADETVARDLAVKRGVDARILGRLDQSMLAELYGAADVLALPSYHEGLPVVICEAMLSQRAIVATNVGGIPEIIEDGVNGLLVAPGRIRDLARAITQLRDDTDLRGLLAQRAYDFASLHLTWRVSALGYDKLYREVVEERLAGTIA
jgi:glycosyltransferase involved in cell wall biosynthesis